MLQESHMRYDFMQEDDNATRIASAAALATAEEMVAGLPDRISHVISRWAEELPHQIALVAGSASWTYRE
jgi:hypothetical protein